MMWPFDDFPIENGGHTYLGFITVKEKRFWRMGVVEPIPKGNFLLLSKNYRDSFREEFKKKGYTLIA